MLTIFKDIGMPTMERDWSLDKPVKEYCNENEDGTLKLRVCQECFSTFETASVCPYCGATYQISPVEIQNFKEIQLKKIEEEKEARRQQYLSNISNRVRTYRQVNQCKSWAELTEYTKWKNFKPGYAYVMAKKYGIPIPKQRR